MTNKNVVVLGSSGMLGRYVTQYLDAIRYDIDALSLVGFLTVRKDFLKWLIDNEITTVINCIGVINSRVEEVGIPQTIQINSVFPHVLAHMCAKAGIELYHISTDCVYDGKKFCTYDENSPHNATDWYGRSKSLGEPDNCSVIRTSIIGEEIGRQRSLVEWFKSHKGGKCRGYLNHYWNGVTCLELAKIIGWMVSEDYFWDGPRHVFTLSYASKLTMLKTLNRIYDLNVEIEPVETEQMCDRRLSTIYRDAPYLNIPSIEEQIQEMKEYKLK